MYNIRPCSIDDVGNVLTHAQQWQKEDITHGFLAPNMDDLQKRVGSLFYVVEVESQIVGFAYGTIHTSEGLAVIPKGERYIEVDDIYIHPDHRSKALGSKLLNHLLKEAESKGVVRSLIYSATKDWERITKFYKDNGYKMWYVQMYK